MHTERVSTFELFFDLVFVFTITQLTSALHADSNAVGVARVLLMLAVIWWMYGGYAWLTNAVSAEIGKARLALLVGMIGFLAVSLAIPTAFTTGGVLFGLGYLLVVLVHATLFGQAGEGAIRGMRVVAPRNVVAALVLTLAGVLAPRTGAVVDGRARSCDSRRDQLEAVDVVEIQMHVAGQDDRRFASDVVAERR